MNPEPPPTAATEAPAEGPAVASPAAPVQAAAAETEPSPEASTAEAPTTTETAAPAAAPDLSPAATGARLVELFPALFAAPSAPGPAKPIKLRIHADIQARAPGIFTKRALGIFFSRYTTTNAYLKALASAPTRFDLDGQPAGEIADEHRQAATEELARRHALGAERRAAQRPAARREAPPAGEGAAGPDPRETPRPDRPHAPRPEMRPDTRSEQRTGARPDRPRKDRQDRQHAPPRPATRPADAMRPPGPETARRTPPAPMPAAALPADPAQRERALLLRSFESSPLSKANFCALKRISEADLDAALAQAERGPSPSAPHRHSGGR